MAVVIEITSPLAALPPLGFPPANCIMAWSRLRGVWHVKLVYTHENSLIVGNARGLLEAQGIEVVTRNEYSQGGVGELSAFDTWPEVWVVRDRDYDRAVAVLEASLSTEGDREWQCPRCGDRNDVSFEICWRCGGLPA